MCVQARFDAASLEKIPYNIYLIDTDETGAIVDTKYYQVGETRRTGINLLTILANGRTGDWRPWENTLTGKRGKQYLEAKKNTADELIDGANRFFGPLKNLKTLDVYTPLTIRDWMNSPEGSAYGVRRSSDQLISAAALNRTPVKGLFLAGQSVMAPGIIGAIFGSLATVKFIIGPDRFKKEIVIE